MNTPPGQDGLQDEIAAALTSLCVCEDEANHTEEADAILPIVQAHIDAAREQVAEQIAQAIDDNRDPDPSPASARWWLGWVEGCDDAARIARQHAKGDGDE